MSTSKGKQSFAVKRTRTGLGLFTLKDIAKGKRIIEYIGPIVTEEEMKGSRAKYFFELDEKLAIDGRGRDNLARYINHSCRPNAKGYTSGKRIFIWALKAIKAGEELTIDYGREYTKVHIKKCKCAHCIGEPKKKASKSKG